MFLPDPLNVPTLLLLLVRQRDYGTKFEILGSSVQLRLVGVKQLHQEVFAADDDEVAETCEVHSREIRFAVFADFHGSMY